MDKRKYTIEFLLQFKDKVSKSSDFRLPLKFREIINAQQKKPSSSDLANKEFELIGKSIMSALQSPQQQYARHPVNAWLNNTDIGEIMKRVKGKGFTSIIITKQNMFSIKIR